MNIGIAMDIRNKVLNQISEVLKECAKDESKHLYLFYDFLPGRNSKDHDWQQVLSLAKACNIELHDYKDVFDKKLDYLISEAPYQIINNPAYHDFLKKHHDNGTKVLYMPYDLPATADYDLDWSKNNLWSWMDKASDIVDTAYAFTPDIYQMAKSHEQSSGCKVKLVPCTRFNGPAVKTPHSRYTIIYSARWCVYDEDYHKTASNLAHVNDIIYQDFDKYSNADLLNCQSIAISPKFIPAYIMLAKDYPEVDFVVRFHPEFITKNPKEYAYIKLMASFYSNIIFDEGIADHNDDWLQKADLVVTEYTSWIMDVIRQNIPIIQISDYDKMLPIYKDCCYSIDIVRHGIDKLVNTVKAFIELKPDTFGKAEVQKQWIAKYHLCDHNAAEFVKTELI